MRWCCTEAQGRDAVVTIRRRSRTCAAWSRPRATGKTTSVSRIARSALRLDRPAHAAAVRAKPIALTAIAAMVGGFFILDDPIFGGLAVSLIFGLLVSTLLTLVVIPVVYYHYHWKAQARSAR